MTIHLIISLLLAHFIADFVFQTDKDVKLKNTVSGFLRHISITTILSYLCVGVLGLWELILYVFITHGIIDLIKRIIIKDEETVKIFLADQLAHIAVIFIAAQIFSSYQGKSIWLNYFGLYYAQISIFIIASILIVKAGSIFIGLFVRPYFNELEGKEERGLKYGGKIIGCLERTLIFVFIFMDYLGGVGFLIAAKSIFRFGELINSKNRKEAEYIIIGTFASFAYAIIISFLIKYALNKAMHINIIN